MQVVALGILAPPQNGLLRFVKDAEVESASSAASLVAGGNVNGRVNFKRVSDGHTIRDVEEAEAGEGSSA